MIAIFTTFSTKENLKIGSMNREFHFFNDLMEHFIF